MKNMLSRFLSDDKGATAIEYGLIAALVALVGVVAFTTLGETVAKAFTDMAEVLCNATDESASLSADGVCE